MPHELGTTILYVTHDQVEALTMSTRIAIFFEGELEQVAPPMDLYQNPVSLRVADFIGNPRINFIDGEGSFAADGSLVVDSVMGALLFLQVFSPVSCPPQHASPWCLASVRKRSL